MIELFVLCYSVIDLFLDGQDVVLIAQVTRSLPRNLNAPWCREGCQIHSCSRLNTYTYFKGLCCSILLEEINSLKCPPTARPRSMFSPTLICMCRPNRAFMLRSFSLFISCVCSSYSIKGSRLDMAVAFTSPWAFFFRRHSLEDNKHWH